MSLHAVTADAFYAYLGKGDDVLDTSGGNNNVDYFTAFGGEGNDTFHNAASNDFQHLHLNGFEHIT